MPLLQTRGEERRQREDTGLCTNPSQSHVAIPNPSQAARAAPASCSTRVRKGRAIKHRHACHCVEVSLSPGTCGAGLLCSAPGGAGGNQLSSCCHTPSGNAEDAGPLGQWQREKKNPTGSWRAGCNEAAAVPDALKISRGPQPLAASPVWGQGSPTITHGAPSGDPKDACPVIWGGRGCSPACCDALRSSGRARQPARRRPSASSHGQTCRDKARLLAVEMGPWVPFQLSKQEQNPLSTGSARGPGARRPPVPSIVPRGSRAGCSWGQQHLWDLVPVLPLAPSGAGSGAQTHC